MRSRTRSLLPVLAGLVALTTLGMPEGVAGQGKSACSKCVYTEAKDKEDPPIPGCEPLTKGDGYKECHVKQGAPECTFGEPAPEGPNCTRPLLLLDGRAGDPGSRVVTAAVVGVRNPRWRQPSVAAETAPAAARHACTGAIVNRRYSPARVAELRTGLRRVTI